MPRQSHIPIHAAADLKPHCRLCVRPLPPLSVRPCHFISTYNKLLVLLCDSVNLDRTCPLSPPGPGTSTHRLAGRCPRSRSPAERCPGGKAAASRRCSPRYFRSPPRRCWTTSTCRSPARSSGKTSKRSAAERAPGSARNAPPPAGTATSPRLSSPRCPAGTPGSGFCSSRRTPSRRRRTEPPRPAGPADTSSCIPVYSRAAWPGAAVRAPPW